MVKVISKTLEENLAEERAKKFLDFARGELFANIPETVRGDNDGFAVVYPTDNGELMIRFSLHSNKITVKDPAYYKKAYRLAEEWERLSGPDMECELRKDYLES